MLRYCYEIRTCSKRRNSFGIYGTWNRTLRKRLLLSAENTFRALGHEHVYVGTVEGFPNLDYIIGRLKKHNITRVHLMPFMIVAGDHAQNDMAGEEPDSWKSVLENEGFQVTVQLDGLGSFPETGQLFVSHLDKAETIPKDNFIL